MAILFLNCCLGKEPRFYTKPSKPRTMYRKSELYTIYIYKVIIYNYSSLKRNVVHFSFQYHSNRKGIKNESNLQTFNSLFSDFSNFKEILANLGSNQNIAIPQKARTRVHEIIYTLKASSLVDVARESLS